MNVWRGTIFLTIILSVTACSLIERRPQHITLTPSLGRIIESTPQFVDLDRVPKNVMHPAEVIRRLEDLTPPSAAFLPQLSSPVSTVTLAWDPPTNALSQGIAGYRVYWGATTNTVYTNSVDAGSATTLALSNLFVGTKYFFAATDYTTNGIESDFSMEIVFTVPAHTNAPPTNVVTIATQILVSSNLVDWIVFTNMPVVVLTNPPLPPAYFRSWMSITSTNTSYRLLVRPPSTLVITNK